MRDEVVGTLSLTLFFGMDLFFVLSGFLIGTILLVSLERHGRQMVGNFYLRRAFRILPLYYVVLTVLALVTPLTALQRHHLPLEYLYLTNFVPDLQRTSVVMIWGWSLALEEQFYLIVPLLLVIGPRSRRFGLYMWLGMISTAIVVLGVGGGVFWYMVSHG